MAEILIFFRDPRHFFIADTLTWMAYRHRSLGEFLAGFARADPSFWYRPLAQRALESLLFPLVRLNPLPYRVAGFILFFSCTIAVFLLAQALTESRRAAWFSVLVFMPHLIHVYVTYDVAFTPELLFTLFWVGSAICYVRYLKTRSRNALIVSVLLFAGSLLSKETAAGLPFLLLAIGSLYPRKERGMGWSVLPHFAILGIYLAFMVGYVHVRHADLKHVLAGDAFTEDEFKLSIGRHVLTNIGAASSWAFGFPGGVHGQWEVGSTRRRWVLQGFCALICIGTVCVLFTSRRWVVILGIAWFLIAAGPAMALQNHFLPYYLFSPLVGFAFAAGTIVDWVYAQCSKISPLAAMAAAILLFAGWGRVHIGVAARLAAESSLLGGAARVSGIAYEEILAAYPKLPEGATLILFSEDVPSATIETGAGLFQLAYDNPSLVTEFSTVGFSFPLENPDTEKMIAFKWVGDHFLDVTPFVRQRPDLLRPHDRAANYHLELPETGSGAFMIRVPELANMVAIILYAVDGKVMEPVRAPLDNRGEGKFDVTGGAKPGNYTFVAVRRENESAWVIVDRSIRVK